MNVEEALRHIRSHEFAARVGVASGLKTFLRALGQERAVRALLEEMSSPAIQARVLAEVLELSALEVDYRYQNRWDIALAALVWSLVDEAPEVAPLAAAAAIRAPQCWWAHKVGDRVLGTVYSSEHTVDVSLAGPVAHSSRDTSVTESALRGNVLAGLVARGSVGLYETATLRRVPPHRTSASVGFADHISIDYASARMSSLLSLPGAIA